MAIKLKNNPYRNQNTSLRNSLRNSLTRRFSMIGKAEENADDPINAQLRALH